MQSTGGILWKKVFLEILQHSQEKICARVSFLLKLKASGCNCNFIKEKTLAQIFSCEFCKLLRTLFLTEHLQWLLLTILIKCNSLFKQTTGKIMDACVNVLGILSSNSVWRCFRLTDEIYALWNDREVKIYCMGLATFEIDCSVKQMTFSL